MKLGPVTKLDKRNKITSKKIDNGAMSANFDVIVICPIYGQSGAIRKPDSGRIVFKTYILIKSNLLSFKTLRWTPKKPTQIRVKTYISPAKAERTPYCHKVIQTVQ